MVDRQPWAIFDKNDRLVFLDLAEDEEAAWRVWLGWPGAAEIADAKQRGERAVRVSVVEMVSDAT